MADKFLAEHKYTANIFHSTKITTRAKNDATLGTGHFVPFWGCSG
jgi:hypothetical protein